MPRSKHIRLSLMISTVSVIATTLLSSPVAAEKVSATVWQEAFSAFQQGDCATAMTLLDPRLKQGAGPDAPEASVVIGYNIAATCSFRSGKNDDAYNYAVRGTALNGDTSWLWRVRLATEVQRQQYVAAVDTVESMADGSGAALNATPLEVITRLSGGLKDEHRKDEQLRLLKALLEKGYVPEQSFAPLDSLRRDYAELLIADGDSAGAAAQIRRIDEPYVANQISFDPRFRSMLPADFDVRAAVERRLEEARVQIRAHPEQLRPIVQAAIRLRQLGRPQESLAVLEVARPSIAREGAFTDAEAQLNWWWDGIAHSHVMLGHYDEAVAAMRSGVDAKEQGGLNVSQLINLAGVQTGFGKPDLALKTLAPFDDAKMPLSPFGEMALRSTRGCANALAGKPAAAAADLAYARLHEADGRRGLVEIQLCVGDLNGAAATIIRQLDDPDRRTATLVDLSDFDDPPVVLPVDPIQEALKKLKLRPDVKAAIARAGGTRRIHLQNVEL